MNKVQWYLLELDDPYKKQDLNQNPDFIKNIQTAILLSLLQKGQLTKWQFDLCLDKLK